jgi:hypothetical protein
MSRRRRKGRKKNPGWFKPGFDPRRSTYRFTPSDCRVGWLVANIKHPHLRTWLTTRLRCYYHQKGKTHGPQEEGR